MKKSFIIPLLVFVLSLCFAFPGFCKGELGDNDAFTTYIGRTRSEVRRIAPVFEELEDDIYVVDLIEEDEEILALAVSFDDYNLVQSVIILVTKGALKIIGIEDSLENVAALGVFNLGFTEDSIKEFEINDDGNFVINIKGGINVVATELSDTTYMVVSFQK